jgi:hypothetical protein
MTVREKIERALLDAGYTRNQRDPTYWCPPEGEDEWTDKLLPTIQDALERESE